MSDDYYAEIAVLGCLLTDSSSFDEIVGLLLPDDFDIHLHKATYKAISELISSDIPVDSLSVEGRLKTTLMAKEDVFIQLCEIARSPFVVSNIKHYANSVRKKSLYRQLIRVAQGIIASVESDEDNVLDNAQKKISAIGDMASSEVILTKDRLRKVIITLDERMQSPGGIIGIPTGFKDLDVLTHGLHPGDLIVLAARPSMGKTLLGLNIAEHLAIKEQKTALVFSLEMGAEQLLERSISSIGRISANKLKSGTFDASEHNTILNTVRLLETPYFIIDDRSSITVADIRAKCRRVKRDFGLSLVVVDYISLMGGDGENETLRIGAISRGLKLLARDLNVPIIAISQLNRGVEQRINKRPTMSDLRQSGAIEQDADLIFFIYRDDVYDPLSPNKGAAELIIAKHRNGNIGTIYLTFNGHHCRFDDHSGIYVQEQPKKVIKTWGTRSYDD